MTPIAQQLFKPAAKPAPAPPAPAGASTDLQRVFQRLAKPR